MAANEPSTDAPTDPKIVHAYVFLQSNTTTFPHATIVPALQSALSMALEPLSSPIELSPRVLYQAYTTLSSPDEGPDLRLVRQSSACADFETRHGAEMVLLNDIPQLQTSLAPTRAPSWPLKLAVFDMDSTLIDQEVIDELAAQCGRKAQVQAITERAMRGELDFAASLRERVGMLAGVRADVWTGLRERITIAQGARELCAALKAKGVKMAVLSGGFQPMADWLKGELGLDVAVANHLLTSSSSTSVPDSTQPHHLTGHLDPNYPIITALEKRKLLHTLAAQQSASLSETLCVGDGANDLPMLQAVGSGGGLAIACRAKPRVQQDAPNRLSLVGGGRGLADLIYLFDPYGAERSTVAGS